MKAWEEMSSRERDALVAEKVMGWTWDDKTSWSPSGSKNSRTDGSDPWWWLPHYSTDIAAAFEVVEKMRLQEWALILDNMHQCLGNWQAHFERDKWVETAESWNVAEAICKAALKVNEAMKC